MEHVDKSKQSGFAAWLEELRPIDDVLMRCMFWENRPLAQKVLRIISEEPGLRIDTVETQADMKIPGARSVELDVYCHAMNRRCIDLEVETDISRGEAHRLRYHGSVIDVKNLFPQQRFSKLPDTDIIFIMNKDKWKRNLPRYHVSSIVEETGEKFGDGMRIIYANAQYRDDTEFGRLMADFMETDPEKMHIKEMREACYYFKRTKEGRRKMSSVAEKLKEVGRIEGRIEGEIKGRREGEIQGRRKGRREGKKEGKKEGKREGAKITLDIISRRNVFPGESYEMTAKAVGCSIREVERVALHKPRTWRS